MENEELEVEVEQTENESTNEVETEKTYSQADVDKLLQAESDRRVTQALKKQQKELEAKYRKQESLSKMNDVQRKEAEMNDRIAELEALVKENAIEKERNEITKVLISRNLPVELSDFITLTDDNVENLDKIDELNTILNKWISKEVTARINGTNPAGTKKGSSYMTKEEFQKLPITQQQEMYQRNPEKIRRLLGR